MLSTNNTQVNTKTLTLVYNRSQYGSYNVFVEFKFENHQGISSLNFITLQKGWPNGPALVGSNEMPLLLSYCLKLMQFILKEPGRR